MKRVGVSCLRSYRLALVSGLLLACSEGDNPNRPTPAALQARAICGELKTPCCSGVDRCKPGARCGSEGIGTCCAMPMGAACQDDSDCCNDLVCDSGARQCCAPAGAYCQSSQECCGGLLCSRNRCQAPPDFCGRPGQVCCDDGACMQGQSCEAGICQRCGQPGQRCCEKAGHCFHAGVCGASSCFDPFSCGGAGESCCKEGNSPCRDSLRCDQQGFCVEQRDSCEAASDCYECRNRVGCGWCEGRGCLPGSPSGASEGNCNAERWTWNALHCPGASLCQAGNATQCAALAGCGWCGDHYIGVCQAGTASGPKEGFCAEACWSYSQSAPEKCTLGLWDRCVDLGRAACLQDRQCGWCGDERVGICREGTDAGPSYGTCCWSRGNNKTKCEQGIPSLPKPPWWGSHDVNDR